MDGAFSSYHPAVTFGYFAAVTIMTMLLMDPAFLAVSLIGALVYSASLRHGGGGLKLRVMLPVLLAVAAINPLFVHEGRTVMFSAFGVPVTFESFVYGICAAAMLAAALKWFECWGRVMGTDKFIALFARKAPSAALLLSMTLRLIPRFKHKTTEVTAAQRALGAYAEGGSARDRAVRGIRVFSVLSGWALEDSEQTADSMKARGYGLKGRTAYSGVAFSLRRDGALMVAVCVCVGICAAGVAAGGAGFVFYPAFHRQGGAAAFTVALGSYAVLCFIPSALEFIRGLSWRASRRNMGRGGADMSALMQRQCHADCRTVRNAN